MGVAGFGSFWQEMAGFKKIPFPARRNIEQLREYLRRAKPSESGPPGQHPREHQKAPESTREHRKAPKLQFSG
jgi:hypothetical protein